MANTWFQFKQFTVHHHLSAMKVGTDGVLLGAWADGANASMILDVGTGSGLLALMMAQRFPNAHIHAIDIVEDAVLQARENALLSPWAHRIEVHHQSLQQYATHNKCLFDVVVCNPPYFTNSLPSPDQHRTTARHNLDLSFDELTHGISSVLKPDGRFCAIIPCDQQQAMINAMAEAQFYAVKMLWVHPLPQRPPKRVLMEFKREKSDCIIEALTIETYLRHHYSDEYKALTRDFYMKF